MARKNRRLCKYPKLTNVVKDLLVEHLLACREDFFNGFERCKLMLKISQEDWVKHNVTYYRHCLAATDYLIDKVKVFKKVIK